MKLAIINASNDLANFPEMGLYDIAGYPLLERSIKQTGRIKDTHTVVCISKRSIDNPLVEFAKERGCDIFRGEGYDVVSRVAACIEQYQARAFTVISHNHLFTPPELINEAFEILKLDNSDIVTTKDCVNYPIGYSVKVMRSSSFEVVNSYARGDERHFITDYYYRYPEKFIISNFPDSKMDYSQLNLAIKTIKDAQLISAMIKAEPDICIKSLKQINEIYNLVH